jgi:hypothetical protein
MLMRLRHCGRFMTLVALILMTGCTGMWPRWFDSHLPAPDPPLRLLVAPVAFEASITHASNIYSFDESSSDDTEPYLREQLIDEVAVHAQRVLTEHLATRPEFQVTSFAEARRLPSGSSTLRRPWTDLELQELGRVAEVDIVVAARINDYGRLGWRHWLYGWLTVASTHTAIVGAATAWNPLAMGAYLVYDLATDLPLWYGGAYVFGWAFRPVHIEMDALQLKGCVVRALSDEEVTVLAAKKELGIFPEAQRRRKEVQLQINLDRTMKTLAEVAGNSLRLKPCAST